MRKRLGQFRRWLAEKIEYWYRFTPVFFINSIYSVLGVLFVLGLVLLMLACEPQTDQKIKDSERVRNDVFRVRCVTAGGTPAGSICLKDGKTLPIFP